MISYKKIIQAWDQFFFKPEPTETMALFRILWGLMLLAYFMFDLNNMQDIYGAQGILSLETVKSQFNYPHLNLFHLFGVTHELLFTFFIVYGLALVCLILGYKTRYSSIVVLCCMVSLHQRNIWVTSSSETLMRIMTILLVFSPCGKSLSLDSLGEKKNSYHAPWVLRLMQIQLSVVYLWTVWQKFKGETWLDGTAVYYATRFESMKNLPLPFLLDNMTFLKISTWGTLIVETALGLLIWVKEWRKPVLIAGIVFHLGIEYIMCIPFFEWTMMCLLMLFVSPYRIRYTVAMLAKKWEVSSWMPLKGFGTGIQEKL